MNILFVAPKSDFTAQVRTTLEIEGHQVVFLDDRQDYSLPAFLRSWRFLWRIGRRIPWMRRRSNVALQKRIFMVTASRPQLLFSIKGMNIRPTTLDAIRSAGATTAIWLPDNAANEPYASWVQNATDDWDHFFSFDSAIEEQMPTNRRAKVHVLPFGVDPAAFDPEPITDADRKRYACDVCFIGAPYPDRVALLEQVKDRDLRIWGWEGWKKTPLARFYRGPLNAHESAKAYWLAKVNVNTNVRPRARGVNLKTFEICAAGGFQLTDEPADLPNTFTIGEELDTYSNEQEFGTKVAYWLSQDTERNRIAEAGRARTLRDHTLQARVHSLLNVIAS